MAWYTQVHVRRVIRLSQALLAAHPHSFAGVDASLAVRFAALHDRSKTGRNRSFLERHGIDQPFSVHLHALWGRCAGPRERGLIDRMNEVDRCIATAFFHRHAIEPEVAVRYERLVHIADLVDRGMDETSRHDEMGRELAPASQILEDAHARELATWLEGRYHTVVSATECFNSMRHRWRIDASNHDHRREGPQLVFSGSQRHR
jgi:hypothetical protein